METAAVPQVLETQLPTGQSVAVFENRDQWLANRRRGIGSSDAAAVLGVSKWASPLSLFYEKRDAPPESKAQTEFQRWGLILEEPIAQRFSEEVGRKVYDPTFLLGPTSANVPSRHVIVRDAEEPRLAASPDRLQFSESRPVNGRMGLLEIKNASIYVADEWNEETGEPPLEYQVQVQHQLMVTGLQWASIAALIGGSKFVWAEVARDEEFIAALRKAELEFLWHLDNDVPPPADGSNATKDLLRRIYPRDTGEIITLPPEALDYSAALIEAKAQIKHWESMKQTAENQLKALLGDATMGTLSNGDSWSYRHQARAEHVVKASEFRVLRHHGAKK